MKRTLKKIWLVTLLAAAGFLGGCASLPASVPGVPSLAIKDGQDTALGRLAGSIRPPNAGELSGFRLLPESSEALEARLALVRRSQRALDVQYYFIDRAGVGLLFLRELRDAASRGVRVRLLLDDLNATGEDELLVSLASYPNVEIRMFNPLSSRADSLVVRLLLSSNELRRVNHRMHNKMLIADNSFAIAGGRNIADDYFQRSTSENYIDVDVLAAGPVVLQMSDGFDTYWNSRHVYPIEKLTAGSIAGPARQRRFDEFVQSVAPEGSVTHQASLPQIPISREMEYGFMQLTWARANFFVDDPEKITRSPAAAYRGSVSENAWKAVNSAKSAATVVSPYFLPDQTTLEGLKSAAESGRSISVFTNSLGATDVPLVYAGYADDRADLLSAGIKLWEIRPNPQRTSMTRAGPVGRSITRLHAKISVIDGSRLFIGSMNLDPRSAAINTECALVIDSQPLVDSFQQTIAKRLQDEAFELRLSQSTGEIEWMPWTARGKIFDAQPGGHYLLRLEDWLLLRLIGDDLL